MKTPTSKRRFWRLLANVILIVMILSPWSSEAIPARAQAACGGTTINYGESKAGTLTSGSAICEYRLTVEGDAWPITAKMSKESYTLDPFLELVDEYGTVVAWDDDGAGNGNSMIRYYEPATHSEYRIRARSYNGASSGSFTLQLGMPYGEWVYGRITSTGSYQGQEFIFYGDKGDVVNIWMLKYTQSLDPWLDLRDPSGYIVASDDDSYGNGDSQIVSYRLLDSGVYTIIARSYNYGSTGDFRVLLEKQ